MSSKQLDQELLNANIEREMVGQRWFASERFRYKPRQMYDDRHRSPVLGPYPCEIRTERTLYIKWS
jgi:hypothetical protein